MFLPPEAPFLGYAAECDARDHFFDLLTKSDDPCSPWVQQECAREAGYTPTAYELHEALTGRC